MKRKAAVAGSFYPSDRAEVCKSVERLVNRDAAKADADAVISPHAGIIYSGAVAGEVYSRVRIPDRVIIIGPNHGGYGSFISIYPEGHWETPMGDIQIDEELCAAVIKKTNAVKPDSYAHEREHSIEVQLPFLKFFNPDIMITPIIIQAEHGLSEKNTFLEQYLDVAQALAEVTAGLDVLLVASSDMSHFETERKARKQDEAAIKKIIEIDPEGLYNTVKSMRITMCGVVPVTIALSYCRQRGKTKADIVKYATSGDVSGDYSSVVAYLGAVV